MINRRGFFAALAGLSAAPAIGVALAQPTGIEIWGVSRALVAGSAAESILIHRACRMLCVICDDETLSRSHFKNAQLVLRQMLDHWAAHDMTPLSEEEVCYGLASRLAREYGVSPACVVSAMPPLPPGIADY